MNKVLLLALSLTTTLLHGTTPESPTITYTQSHMLLLRNLKVSPPEELEEVLRNTPALNNLVTRMGSSDKNQNRGESWDNEGCR